jgi:hypothetical protein
MAAPGIVTTLIFVFINAWNEYTIALTLISNDVLKPITVGINTFYGYNFIQWQYLFATSLFATVPVIILFLCIEKHLVPDLPPAASRAEAFAKSAVTACLQPGPPLAAPVFYALRPANDGPRGQIIQNYRRSLAILKCRVYTDAVNKNKNYY